MATRLTCLTAALAIGVTSALDAQSISVPASVDTLDNGLTIIVHEDHSAPIATVNVWYHVGSGSELPGRTGFAHLFEHLMFMGSQHAPYPAFDRMLEAAGANNNGSTTEDRTNYYENGPSSALELMLWLEADRMGWMLPTMEQEKLDAQREIVKNERRERVDNAPYGKVTDILPALMYPATHPYSWSVIGSMDDLSAASLEDVKGFFRTWYAPNNAVLVVAGDVQRNSVLNLARNYFGQIPRGPAIEPLPVQPATLTRDTLVAITDRVQMPRLYYSFHTVPAWSEDDAALQVASQILSGSKNSRITRRLQYEEQSVQFVSAYPDHRRHAGVFSVVAQAKPGVALPGLQRAIDEELRRLAANGPTEREMQQAFNRIESGFLSRVQMVSGKADQLNQYFYETGTPDAFQRDLDRLRAVTAADVQRVVSRYLTGPRAIVSVVPEGQEELAATVREVTP